MPTYPLKKLSEICKIKTGKKDVNEGNPNGKFPFFTCAREHTFSDSYSFDMEALLIAGNGDVGHVQYYKGKFEAYQRTYILHDFSSAISVQYLFLYLSSFLKETVSKQKLGNTMPYIKLGMLTEFQIPLPPLFVQEEIVAKLDVALASIDEAKTKTEQSLAATRELWESTLEEAFRGGDGWEEKRLQDICEKITDGTHQTPKYFDSGVVFLSSKNVTSGKIDWENIKYIDQKQHLEMHKRVAPRMNDILLAKNGTTGVAAMVDRDTVFDIYVSLAIIRAKEVISPHFLLYFINSPTAKKQFNKRLKGSGVPNLHLEEIREVIISYPKKLPEQSHIVTHLDTVRAETDRLAGFYEQKLADLDELRRSVLQEAFAQNT